MNNAQRHLWRGVNKLHDVVKLTLGPHGRNVIIDQHHDNPLITNDGVTIARQMTLPHPQENLGALLIKQASIKTNTEAGDGTTSAIVLATALVNHARRYLKRHNPMQIKDELLAAAETALRYLPRYTKKITRQKTLIRVATDSCANTADGKLVAKALHQVGPHGLVTLQMNQTGTTTLEFTNGIKIPAQSVSPYLNDREFHDAYVLVTDGTVSQITDLVPVLEHCMQTQKPLVIIADDYRAEVINALVLNRVKANLPLIALRSEQPTDWAVITGATLVSPRHDLILANTTPAHLGHADKIVFHATTGTVLTNQHTPALDAHLAMLRTQIKDASDNYHRTRLQERYANLTATAAVISVGCPTEAATMEKRLRIEDAVATTQNAMRDGIVRGGGLTYLALAQHLPPHTLGARILKKSLPAVYRQINKNYRFRSQDCTALDAATVIRCVVKNAVSAAAILITTAAIISSAT